MRILIRPGFSRRISADTGGDVLRSTRMKIRVFLASTSVGALLHETAVQGNRRLVNAISLGFQAALHDRGQMVYSFLKVAFDLGNFSLYNRDMFS
jgi:hypothetical protein